MARSDGSGHVTAATLDDFLRQMVALRDLARGSAAASSGLDAALFAMLALVIGQLAGIVSQTRQDKLPCPWYSVEPVSGRPSVSVTLATPGEIAPAVDPSDKYIGALARLHQAAVEERVTHPWAPGRLFGLTYLTSILGGVVDMLLAGQSDPSLKGAGLVRRYRDEKGHPRLEMGFRPERGGAKEPHPFSLGAKRSPRALLAGRAN